MATTNLEIVILSVIIGTLAGIVYSMRILVLLERRVARVDANIAAITQKIMMEEIKIEEKEKQILRKVSARTRSRPKAAKKRKRKK